MVYAFCVPMGFQDFATYFLDEVLSQDMAHIDDLPFLANAHVVLEILSSCVTCQLYYLTQTILLSFSFLFLLAGFNRRIMQICGDITGPRSWESFQGPLARHQAQLLISFGGIGCIFMEDCVPFIFLGSWVLMALYLCFNFCIFYKPILEKYVSHVEGGSHFL